MSNASARARSPRPVSIEMWPPNKVSTLAPMVPKMERERTVTPRTRPSVSTMWYPGSSNVVEVIVSSMGSSRESGASRPVGVDRHAERDQHAAQRGVPGIGGDRARHHVGRGKHEKRRSERVAGGAEAGRRRSPVAPPIDEETGHGEAEEDPVAEGHVVHQLREAARKDQEDRPPGLEQDGV